MRTSLSVNVKFLREIAKGSMHKLAARRFWELAQHQHLREVRRRGLTDLKDIVRDIGVHENLLNTNERCVTARSGSAQPIVATQHAVDLEGDVCMSPRFSRTLAKRELERATGLRRNLPLACDASWILISQSASSTVPGSSCSNSCCSATLDTERYVTASAAGSRMVEERGVECEWCMVTISSTFTAPMGQRFLRRRPR
jgi:hypothetical protein